MIRAFLKSDFPTIEEWWSGHDAKAPVLELLSEDGLIVEDVCAAWLYTGNSTIAFLGWPVGNPEADRETVHAGLKKGGPATSRSDGESRSRT